MTAARVRVGAKLQAIAGVVWEHMIMMTRGLLRQGASITTQQAGGLRAAYSTSWSAGEELGVTQGGAP